MSGSISFTNIEEVLKGLYSFLLSAEEEIEMKKLKPSQLMLDKWVIYFSTKFSQIFPQLNFSVVAFEKGKAENTKYNIPMSIYVEMGGFEPLDIKSHLPKKVTNNIPLIAKKSSYWNVTIQLPPQDPKAPGHCFFMTIMIPRDSLRNNETPDVLVGWLYRVMIDPDTHTKVTMTDCLGPGVPDFNWGTLFVKLFDTICSTLAQGINIGQVNVNNVIENLTFRAPVLAGMVDDAFLEYCGHSVNMSDMRRISGSAPWYESFGYKMANINEYASALVTNTYGDAKESVERNYRDYIAAMTACKQEVMPAEEREQFCQKNALCESLSTRGDVARYIASNIAKNDEERGCFWVSDQAPKTCLTQFNRKYNPQTWHYPEEDFVCRLKFYS